MLLEQLMDSIISSQISLGRGLRRTIDMFHSPRDLFAEKERRIELADTDEVEGEEITDE